MTLRVAIVATHPIQYQVPWFQALAARPEIALKVYFALLPDATQQGGSFGVPFNWDIPMLEGYAWTALPNARAHPRLGTFWGTSTPAIVRTLRREPPDVVLITGWNALPLVQALWACMRLRIPRIVRGESNALRVRPPWVRALHRAFLSRYDAFLAIGNANRAFYLGNGVPASKLFVAPYFVDNQRFASAAARHGTERAALRRAWGIGEDAVCFLFAGKLEPKKRILDLLSAAARARQQGASRVHLLVVGSGELMESAKALARRESVPTCFAGFLNQTEMPKAYVAADCLVLPSDFGETWGLVVNEAMACGRPAVVSDRVGCAADLVEDGVTGRVFPFGDIESLARALASLANAPERLAIMGAQARTRIDAYSVDTAVGATLDAVRHVARRAD